MTCQAGEPVWDAMMPYRGHEKIVGFCFLGGRRSGYYAVLEAANKAACSDHINA